MKTKAFRIKIYRDAIENAVVPGQIDRLMLSARNDPTISWRALSELKEKANVKKEKLFRKQFCWRKGCRYWRDPREHASHSCDYMMLTGRSRIKQIPDPKLRSDFSRCPLFERGPRKRLKKAKHEHAAPSNTKYDWDKAREMYDAGATDREIFTALGCARKTVQYWRRKNELEPNREAAP